MSRISTFFDRLLNKYLPQPKDMLVVLDPVDNSVTMSSPLFRAIGGFRLGQKSRKLYTFRDGKDFGFSIDPKDIRHRKVNYTELQYDEMHKAYGYMSICPTVSYMYHIWGVHPDNCDKVSVHRVKRIFIGLKPCYMWSADVEMWRDVTRDEKKALKSIRQKRKYEKKKRHSDGDIQSAGRFDLSL